MFDCNQTLTVWNKWTNPASASDVHYYRMVLSVKCKWAATIQRNVTGTTANIANSFLSVVPYTDAYKTPNEWSNMGADQRLQYFTLQAGDILALGERTDEITNTKGQTTSDLLARYKGEIMTIKAIADNTMSAMGKHWRVEGT